MDKFSFRNYRFGEDPFYALINVIVKTLGGRFYMVQIVQAAIVNVLIFKYIRRHSQYLFTCVLFYFFINYVTFTMEIMRGSISIALCLFGNDYIVEKKWFKGYLLYIIASFFHFQTIVLFVLPALFWIRFNRIGFSALFVAFIVGIFLKGILGDYIFLLGGNEILESEMDTKLRGKYSEQHYNLLYYFSTFLIKIVYPLIAFSFVKRYCKKENVVRLEPFILLGVMFVLIQLNFPIAFRYVYYYEPYFAIIFAEVYISIIPKLFQEKRNLHILSFIVFLPLFYFYGYNRYKTHKYHPYTSVIEMSIDKEKEKAFQGRLNYRLPNKNQY